jgi:hypothetical protein
VEITVFTGESNFITSSHVFQTTLPTAGRDWVFDPGHYNNDGQIDLFAIRRNGEFATEIFVISGAGATASSRYSTVLTQGNTAMPRTDKSYEFVVGDIGNDGVPDLVAVRKYGTEYGFLEASVLPGATSPGGNAPFRWFSNRLVIPLSDTTFDWSLDVAYFNSPHALAEDGVLDLILLEEVPGSSPLIFGMSGAPQSPAAVF